MNAVAPGVAEGLDLFRLAGDVVGVAVLDVAAGGGPLEVAVEFDAVGRIEIDALHLAAQAFALGEGGHHLQAVAQDHAVLPVAVMLIELGLSAVVGQAVEVGKEIDLLKSALSPCPSPACGRGVLFRLATQVVDQYLGVDLFLDVDRRRVDDEVGPVLLVLAAPDQLRVQVAVAALIGDTNGRLLVLLHYRLVFGRGDVLAGGVVVLEGFDTEFVFGCFGHALIPRLQPWPRRSGCRTEAG